MKTFGKIGRALEMLYNESLHEYIDKDDLFQAVEEMANDYDKEIKNLPEYSIRNTWKKSLLTRIFLVHQRLLLVRHLNQGRSSKSIIDDILHATMYPGLETYLLLTCFDQLGQPEKGWKFFPNWLSSHKCKQERDEIIDAVLNTEDITNVDDTINLNCVKEIYLRYHKEYGVKNSFFRFFDEILPATQRRKLLDKIQINNYNLDNAEDPKFIDEGNDLDKKKWLYEIRNDYTHNAHSVEKHFTEGYLDFEENWEIRERVYGKDFMKEVLLAESFREEIEQSIILGILELIRLNS